MLFLAVWWAWNYTAWATNWIEPAHAAVRLLLVGLMLVSLVMSASIPAAFGSRGLPFAAAYVGLQVVRSGFMVAAFACTRNRMGRNYAQLLAWSCLAGAVWLGGAFAGRDALGESILAIGATFAGLSWDASVLAAFVVGFAATASFWWTYFGRAEAAVSTIARAADPTRVARLGYAYAHGLMVAGVIVLAVAIDLTIAQPTRDAWGSATAVILGAPALYLAGYLLFKRALIGSIAWSRAIALVALALLVPVATAVDRLALSAAVALVVVVLAAVSGRGSAIADRE